MTDTHATTPATAVNEHLATYDLIIIDHDRLVTHEVFESPRQRLQGCLQILRDKSFPGLDSDKVTRALFSTPPIGYIASESEDQALNRVAKLSRQWGGQHLRLHHAQTGGDHALLGLHRVRA